MEMTDEIRLPLAITDVWAALNDPVILQQAIPGCQTLEQISDTELQASVKVKIGPVSATFKGAVMLSDLTPPTSYVIAGSGTGGVAGSAKGEAQVTLIEEGQDTILRYQVSAAVSGKIAQLGSRLIESTAKKLSTQFFTNFTKILNPQAESAADSKV